MPIGAEVTAAGVSFRVWAPRRKLVEVVIAEGLEQLISVPLYHYRLDREKALLSDPASRFQPEGPLGPSQVIDPQVFRWTDAAWKGLTRHDQVIYEMHIGAFSRAGTWWGAIPQLPALAELGIAILSTAEQFRATVAE